VSLGKLSQVDPKPGKPFVLHRRGPKTLNVKGRLSAKHTGSLKAQAAPTATTLILMELLESDRGSVDALKAECPSYPVLQY
jgi:hypothetical protein